MLPLSSVPYGAALVLCACANISFSPRYYLHSLRSSLRCGAWGLAPAVPCTETKRGEGAGIHSSAAEPARILPPGTIPALFPARFAGYLYIRVSSLVA
jgi:hypothetical protein